MGIFGKRMQIALEQKQMTRAELSRMTGISEPALYYYIKNDSEPKSRNIMKIADALNVDPNWLLGIEQNPINSMDASELFSSLSVDNFGKLVDYARYLLATQEANDEEK